MTLIGADLKLLIARNRTFALSAFPHSLDQQRLRVLRELTLSLRLSAAMGEVLLLDGHWYVTHAGLIRLAQRRHCAGIHTEAATEFCNPQSARWSFKATVYKSRTCKGFAGYGDADPSNVSPLVHGAVIRAVNRASRVEYGIGSARDPDLSQRAETLFFDLPAVCV
jgi:hypothetical protein